MSATMMRSLLLSETTSRPEASSPGDLAREGEGAVAAGLADQSEILPGEHRLSLVFGQPAVDQRGGHVLGQLALVDADSRCRAGR